MKKQMVTLNEEQLRNIVRESITETINEIFDTDYYGFHLANAEGNAERASKSLKAVFNPDYKRRKERQADRFRQEKRNTVANQLANNKHRIDGQEDESGYYWGLKGRKLWKYPNPDLESEYNGNRRGDINKWDKDDFDKWAEDDIDIPGYDSDNV